MFMIFRKMHIAILVILALGVILSAPGVIKRNIREVAFAQAQKNVNEKSQQKTPINEQVMQIIRHVKNGENNSAVKLGKEYLASNPNDAYAMNILTEAYINNDDISSAESTIKRAIAIQPNDPWSGRLLARVYRLKAAESPDTESANLALALEAASTALANNPEDIWLIAEAAQVYAAQGDEVKANAMIDSAIRIAPNEDYLKTVKRIINQEEQEKE